MPRTPGHSDSPGPLVAREVWRRARRRIRLGPIYRWRFTGRVPDRVHLAPPDLRLADPQIAHDIYSGRYPFAGHMVDTGGLSPFHVAVTNTGWLKTLHSFRWLRHLSASGTDLAAANARALVADWIAAPGRQIGGIAWLPGSTAKRIIAWLQHSALILSGAELPFYRAFLKSLAAQLRYLRATVSETPAGKDKLRARIALAFAALALPSSAAAVRSATRNLDHELALQILPDGGHISRNPLTLLELLADLLPLRETYASQAQELPQGLVGAIDRMLPALRFYRLNDGSLARFNGMGMTIHERVNAILRHDDASGAPLLHAPHCGYDRLALGQTVVIADTGAPPAPDYSVAAHAGCLSFEFSSGRSTFVVNCGVDSYGSVAFRPLARATAAHSTVTFNDTSQARFAHSARVEAMIGTPLLGGPTQVRCRRLDSDGMQGFAASHDAYARSFGYLHERQMRLSEDGTLLSGADAFIAASGAGKARRAARAAVRFHIHPDVDIFDAGHDRIGLASRSGEVWIFTCPDIRPVLDESIFFASSGGPRRSTQIVLLCDAGSVSTVEWEFRREAE